MVTTGMAVMTTVENGHRNGALARLSCGPFGEMWAKSGHGEGVNTDLASPMESVKHNSQSSD